MKKSRHGSCVRTGEPPEEKVARLLRGCGPGIGWRHIEDVIHAKTFAEVEKIKKDIRDNWKFLQLVEKKLGIPTGYRSRMRF